MHACYTWYYSIILVYQVRITVHRTLARTETAVELTVISGMFIMCVVSKCLLVVYSTVDRSPRDMVCFRIQDSVAGRKPVLLYIAAVHSVRLHPSRLFGVLCFRVVGRKPVKQQQAAAARLRPIRIFSANWRPKQPRSITVLFDGYIQLSRDCCYYNRMYYT